MAPGILDKVIFLRIMGKLGLVGALEHVLFFHILGMSSSQLTNSYFSEWWLKPPTSFCPNHNSTSHSMGPWGAPCAVWKRGDDPPLRRANSDGAEGCVSGSQSGELVPKKIVSNIRCQEKMWPTCGKMWPKCGKMWPTCGQHVAELTSLRFDLFMILLVTPWRNVSRMQFPWSLGWRRGRARLIRWRLWADHGRCDCKAERVCQDTGKNCIQALPSSKLT